MSWVVLFIALTICAFCAPRLFRAIELLIIAPIVGVAFGGFAWAVSAMMISALITWAAFGTFLAGGVAASVAVFAGRS